MALIKGPQRGVEAGEIGRIGLPLGVRRIRCEVHKARRRRRRNAVEIEGRAHLGLAGDSAGAAGESQVFGIDGSIGGIGAVGNLQVPGQGSQKLRHICDTEFRVDHRPLSPLVGLGIDDGSVR